MEIVSFKRQEVAHNTKHVLKVSLSVLHEGQNV